MKMAVLAGLMLLGAVQAQGKEVKEVAAYDATNHMSGEFKIGVFPTLLVTKACIEGQAYLITRNKEYATGITPALKNGVPQQCKESSPRPRAAK